MKKLTLLLTCILLAGFTVPMDAKTIKDRTFINTSYDGVKTIRVKQSVLDVTITKENSKKTNVKCHVEEMTVEPAEFEIKARMVGSVLEIYQVPEKNVSISFRGKNKGYLNITAPAGVEVITVRNSSGDVDVSGFDLDSLNVSAVSGDVHIGDIVTPVLSVRASSGDVTTERSRGGVLSISTVSGDVDALGADFTSLTLRTSSGDLTVSGAPKARTASFATVSGDLKIASVAASDVFSVKTSSGTVSVSNCSAGPKFEAISVSGDLKITGMSGDIFSVKTSSGAVSIADAKGGQMNATSVSGGITARNSDFTSVNAASSSGKQIFYLGAKLKQVALKTISGGISLYLKGNLKDNRYDLRGVSSTFSIEGFARAERTFQVDSGKGLVDIKGETSSGNITVKNW